MITQYIIYDRVRVCVELHKVELKNAFKQNIDYTNRTVKKATNRITRIWISKETVKKIN